MAAAHAQGIIHRDLKPANILFDEHGEPKVADFGPAKRDSGSDLTATGAVIGTPAYMAPEQAGGKAKVAGPTADVWALGVILFECVTGTRPFDAPDPWGILHRIQTARPDGPRRHAPAVPRALESICLKCLEKDPGTRYADAAALADDLDRFTAGGRVSVRPVSPVGRLRRWARRSPVTAGLGLASVLALVLLAVVAARFPRPDGGNADGGNPADREIPARAGEETPPPALTWDSFDRRPDLVVSEGRPDPGAMIALRADDDLEPGRLSVILDYSGSMACGIDGNSSPGGYKDKGSKLSLALKALEDVLGGLPQKTKVGIRVFSHGKADETWSPAGHEAWLRRKPYTAKVFPFDEEGERPEDYLARKDVVSRRLRSLTPLYATPLVDAVREAMADETFLPHDGSPQTLLVLTDGANTVLGREEAPVRGGVYDVNDAGWKQKVADAAANIRKDIPQNLSVQIVFFGAGQEERVAMEMFDPIQRSLPDEAKAAPVGQLWSARDAGRLKTVFGRVLRPKPRLFDQTDHLVEEIRPWQTGMPTNRVSEPPEWLRWYGPNRINTAAPGIYRLEYAWGDERLRLRPGDRVVVRVSGQGSKVSFRREVYYKDVEPSAAKGRTGEAGGWHAAVPEYSFVRPNDHFLFATGALEKIPPGDGGVIAQPRPGLVWWELTHLADGGERVPDGVVYVRNVVRNQHPAPCWHVIVEDGPEPKPDRVANRLRVGVGEWPDNSPELPAVVIPRPSRLLAAPLTLNAGNDITVRVGLETVPLYPDPTVDAAFNPFGMRPVPCLTLGVNDRRGRLIQARIPSLGEKVGIKEHRYFYVRDGNPLGSRPPVAGYFGVFGPLDAEDALATLPELRIELVSVSGLLADPSKVITLDLGVPKRDAPSVVIEPGSSGAVTSTPNNP